MRERQKWILVFSGKCRKEGISESGQLSRRLPRAAPSALLSVTEQGSTETHVCSCHLEDQCLQLSSFSEIADSQQVGNSQGSTLAPSNFQLFEKFALRVETLLFSSQSMCIFSGFKDAQKKVLIFLDRRHAVFSGLLIGKSEQTVFPFYPSSLPQCAFSVSLQMKPSVRHRKMKGMVVKLIVREPIKDLTF